MQKYENVIFPDIAFECTHCCQCCAELPDLDKGEFNAIVAKGHKNFLDLSDTIPTIAANDEGYCMFTTDDNLCKIHNVKPVGCRLQPFMMVDYDVRKKTIELNYPLNCPGIKKGRLTKEQLEVFGKAAQKMFECLLKMSAVTLKLPIDDERVAINVIDTLFRREV